MKFLDTILQPCLRTSALLIFSLAFVASTPLRADLNNDLAFSAFNNVDVNAMAGGQVLQVKGDLLDFQRGITTQSLFIIDADPATVAQKLVTWDPASHPELKVWIHQALPPKPTVADFANLATLPDNGSVDYLVDATAKLDPNNPALQIDKNEAQLITSLQAQNLDKKALFTTFWSQILANRLSDFFGGKFATDKYSISSGDILSQREILSLLRSDAKVYHDFHPLFARTPLLPKGKGAASGLYFECFDVEGYGALASGAIFQAKSGTALQSADIEYYCNSGIYASVELEKIWPIAIDGKNESLVWREDLVSTANVSYLHGMERMASGMMMLQDVLQGINAFRAEFK